MGILLKPKIQPHRTFMEKFLSVSSTLYNLHPFIDLLDH